MRRRKNNENGESGAIYTDESCRAAANLLIYGLFNYYSDRICDEGENKRAYKRLMKKIEAIGEAFSELNGTGDDPSACSAFLMRMDRARKRRENRRGDAGDSASPDVCEAIRLINEFFDDLLGELGVAGDEDDPDFDSDDLFGDDEIPF